MKHESVLKFKEYYIEELVFQKNNDFVYDTNQEIALDFDFSFGSTRNGENFIRQIKCRIFDENFRESNKPFFIKLVVSGVFHIVGFDEMNEVHNEIINKNTLAILFPYLRSILSHISLEMQIEPILLPPMNINSFI